MEKLTFSEVMDIQLALRVSKQKGLIDTEAYESIISKLPTHEEIVREELKKEDEQNVSQNDTPEENASDLNDTPNDGVEIKGDLRDFVEVTRKAFTQSQAYLIIEQLKRDGARNIRYSFDDMDKLPKGVNLHDKFR